jgi:hypothetical protein
VLQPPVVLLSPFTSLKVNPSSRVTIAGTVLDNERGGVTAYWNITSGSLAGGSALSVMARSPVVIAEPPQGRGTVPITLVIRNNALLPGMAYTVRLTATNSRASGFSQVRAWGGRQVPPRGSFATLRPCIQGLHPSLVTRPCRWVAWWA